MVSHIPFLIKSFWATITLPLNYAILKIQITTFCKIV